LFKKETSGIYLARTRVNNYISTKLAKRGRNFHINKTSFRFHVTEIHISA